VKRTIFILALLSATVAFGQSTATPNIGLKKSVPGSPGSGDAVNANFDKLDSMLSGGTAISALGVKKFNNKMYANHFADSSHADIGSQVNAAIAALPIVGGVPSGVVSLEGYQGTQSLTTTIQLFSHSVSLVGPGKALLTLDCLIRNGDCIRIKDPSFGKGITGAYVGGFSLIGHGYDGAVGMHIGDMFRMHLQDIVVFGFKGANSLGIWFENQSGYTEQLNMTDVGISNSTTDMRFTNSGGENLSPSFGYGTYVNVFMQVGAGQTALKIDGGTVRTQPLVYHSRINWIFEDLRDEPGQENTLIDMADNSALLDNHYSIVVEDQGRNGGPFLKMGNNSILTGFGEIESWGGRSVVLGKNVVFNVMGKVEIGGFDWSPVAGNIFLDSTGKWGSGASVTSVSGQWSFFTFTVTAGGNPQLNPMLAIKFPSPNGQTTWRNPPLYICKQVGGNDGAMLVSGENTASINLMQLMVHGVPTPGSTYIINCQGSAR
jgi:hypothetical protein